jgi:diguanylate cyclase (GGDEF)-like protein
MMTGSWLCRNDLDRERLLDMERRVRPVRAVTIATVIVATMASTGWLGAKTMGAIFVAALVVAGLFAGADIMLKRSERPEYVMFAAWLGAQVLIVVCLVGTGGPNSPALAWLAIPVVTLGARFSQRGIILGVALTLMLLLVATLADRPATVLADPTPVVAAAVVIVCVAVLSTALMHSDIHHRGEAVIDQLTGMLNRRALDHRANELAQQSALTGQPIGLIVGDIDRFKAVNDAIGHSGGDEVLREMAGRLRDRMRAFDLAYRIGGEEFLVLVPGAGVGESTELAEDLRRSVAQEALSGIDVTMSFGLSASAQGTRFDYETVFAAADAALYRAKSAGRNRVCVDADATAAEAKLAESHVLRADPASRLAQPARP